MRRFTIARGPLSAILVALVLLIYITTREVYREAPSGYTWVHSGKIRARLLVPYGWVFREKREKDADIVLITKDAGGKPGSVSPGLTITVLRDCDKTTGMKPSVYTEEFINEMKLASSWHGKIESIRQNDRFKGLGGFFRSDDEESGTIVQFVLAIGNDDTGTLYVAIFRSKEDEWEAAWSAGQTIIDNLALDKGA
ncbi:MAG: hypothetical protein ABIJ27_00755 [Candidatus Omnitrophota bacterium]